MIILSSKSVKAKGPVVTHQANAFTLFSCILVLLVGGNSTTLFRSDAIEHQQVHHGITR